MALQTIYLNNTASTTVPIAAMKKMSLSYGTAINTSTTVTDGSSVTAINQFIPGTVNNNANTTIGTTPDSEGWIFDIENPGRFWPGKWTIQTYLALSGMSGIGNSTGSISAKFWIVKPSATTVTQLGNETSPTFTTTAVSPLIAGNTTYTSTANINQFFYVYPQSRLYVQLYWNVTVNLAGTVTAALWLESPNTFIQTPFFEEQSKYVIDPRRRLGIGN